MHDGRTPKGELCNIRSMYVLPEKNVILHLPITATSSKVAIIERFDCNILI